MPSRISVWLRLSKTAERLWEDYEAFARRDLILASGDIELMRACSVFGARLPYPIAPPDVFAMAVSVVARAA